MSLVSFLFRVARLSADAKAVTSGDPKRVGQRAKNKLVGPDKFDLDRDNDGVGCE